MRAERGFTLAELMIAGAMSAVVVMAGFSALTLVQRNAERQAEANELVAAGRLAMEIIARDVRSAADSVDLLPAHCIDGYQHPTSNWGCPAILEPHPWRLILARNVWTDAAKNPTFFDEDALPPDTTRPFDAEPENLVVYQFTRTSTKMLVDSEGITRNAHLGRLERIVNPFGWDRNGTAVPKMRTVLLENVLLDDRMRVNPADPTQVDHRYDFALFMYQVVAKQGEFHGSLAARGTALDQTFLTPPLRFFPIEDPGGIPTAPPYMADKDPEIVGLETSTTAYDTLWQTGTSMKASDPNSDLRRMLDTNRIRTVRIAFKVVGTERPDVRKGVDLDGDPSTGYAPVYHFETTAEIKTLALYTDPEPAPAP